MKKTLIVLFLLLVTFAGYVAFINRNSKHMTVRQQVLKAVYPVWMWWAKLKGKNAKELSSSKEPPVSFYSLKSVLNDGSELDFSALKGEKVLLVNTASDCGYTSQYAELQKLSEAYPGKLVVIGFPANDFKQQEKGNDEEIAQFCKQNFGISFPLMKKSIVVRSPEQNPVFQWLTDSTKNGWNNQLPGWNFTKYLVNEKGILTNYFGSSISPLSKDVINVIETK